MGTTKLGGDEPLPKPATRDRQETTFGVAPPASATPVEVSPPRRDERTTPAENVFYYACPHHGQMALPEGARKCPECGSDIAKVVLIPSPLPAPPPHPIALNITVQAPPAPGALPIPPPAPTSRPPAPPPAPTRGESRLPAAPKRPRLPTNVEIVRDMLLGSESESPQERWERYLLYAGLTLVVALIVVGIGYTIIRYA